MSHKEIFIQLSHWIVNSYLKSYTFCLYFILHIFTCVDPDPNPYSEYGSGSTKLLNTDPDPQHWLIHSSVRNGSSHLEHSTILSKASLICRWAVLDPPAVQTTPLPEAGAQGPSRRQAGGWGSPGSTWRVQGLPRASPPFTHNWNWKMGCAASCHWRHGNANTSMNQD